MTSQAQKQQAQQLIQQGRPEQAQGILEMLSARNPADAETWFMLGLARAQRADIAGAEQAFRRCVALRADAFGAWDNLGLALLQRGDLAEARRCFRTSIKLNSGNPIPHNGLGQLYRLQNDLPKSAASLREALRIAPRFGAAHAQLALTLRALNRNAEAITHARSAIEINPNAVDAWHTLGELLQSQADFEGAVAAFQRALQLKPGAETWCALGALMEELNRRDAARDSYLRALDLQPRLLRAHIRLGVVLSGQGDIAAARGRLETALEIEPGHPVATAELANVLALQGHYQEALQRLEPLLQGRDTRIEVALAYAALSGRVGQQERARDLLERLDAGGKVPASHQEPLLFALARLQEQACRYEEAFRHYQRAQSLRPLADDIERHLADMDAIRATFSAQLLAALPRADHGSERPVFIVGMPRSGTSLVEQILASHPQVYGGGELTALWKIAQALPSRLGSTSPYPACVRDLTADHALELAREYLDHLQALSAGALRVTDKLPHNFLHLGLIELLFPRAHVIHCVRDPLDTCLSIYFHRFNTSHLYARNLRSLGRYYRAYERLMEHWGGVLTSPMLTMRYEDLVEDVEGWSRRLVDFCGLDWDPACLRFHANERVVNTPSHEQVRRPIYRDALQRWRHYEPWIDELRKGLGS